MDDLAFSEETDRFADIWIRHDTKDVVVGAPGFLFRSTEQIKKDHPELAAYETYDELFDAIKKAMEA